MATQSNTGSIAYLAGAAAAEHGEVPKDCPYPPGTLNADEWQTGFESYTPPPKETK